MIQEKCFSNARQINENLKYLRQQFKKKKQTGMCWKLGSANLPRIKNATVKLMIWK